MKKIKNVIQLIGSATFIIGVILAIIAGFWPLSEVVTSTLIISGLIVGFLNVTPKESNNFLFVTLVLAVISSMGGQVLGQLDAVGGFLQNVFSAMILFIIPAGVVVALKAIYSLAENE